MALTPKYVSIPVFHRYMNEVVGIKIGLNKLYSELQKGEIRSAFIAGKYQIVTGELEDYPQRKLTESLGKPTVHTGMLGNKVSTLNG
jgi:hypothetical protein